MAKKASGPLTEKHLAVCQRLLQDCAESRAFLEKCERCHLAVDPEKRKNDEQERIARQILAEFGQPAR